MRDSRFDVNSERAWRSSCDGIDDFDLVEPSVRMRRYDE